MDAFTRRLASFTAAYAAANFGVVWYLATQSGVRAHLVAPLLVIVAPAAAIAAVVTLHVRRGTPRRGALIAFVVIMLLIAVANAWAMGLASASA